jgi:hypothetical protein
MKAAEEFARFIVSTVFVVFGGMERSRVWFALTPALSPDGRGATHAYGKSRTRAAALIT